MILEEEYKILVIEDSPEYQIIIKTALHISSSQFLCSTIKQAENLLSNFDFDLIILDLNLPDGDGLSFFNKIKFENQVDCPIIFLTAKDDISDKVVGLSLGADDYLTKPINPLELRARVMNKIFKFKGQKKHMASGLVQVTEGFYVDYHKNLVSYLEDIENTNFTKIELTNKEFKLLTFLLKNKEQILQRNYILDKVWGNNANVIDRTIDTTIFSLRKKIGPYSKHIRSIFGVGYKWEGSPEAVQKAS